MVYNSAVLASTPCELITAKKKLQTGVVEMLDEKAIFATINKVAMRNLQTYGMTVKNFYFSSLQVGLLCYYINIL